MGTRKGRIRDVKYHLKFVENHDREFILGGLFLFFLLSIGLAFSIYSNMNEKYQLEMKFRSEKSFNSVYITMVDNPSKAGIEMKNEGVIALGIYSSNGILFQGLGDIPVNLPINKLGQSNVSGTDSTLGIYYYDSDTREIEYYRLSRLNAAMETGLYFGKSVTSEVPEIFYVRFDGTQYFKQIARAELVLVLSIIGICGVFILIVSTYMANRRYKTALIRNENLAQLGAAARTLTHEIKNPLSALTIQTALMKKTLPSEYQEDLALIDHEVTRLTNLTNRVSEFLKNPVGNPDVIDLVPFLKGIISIFQIPIGFKSFSDSVFIKFDRDRARSVFENLIKNATESTETRDPEVEVEIRRMKKHMVCIAIKDRGDGISPEAKDKLFDPFYTTKIHGSGIGLSISRQFVQARGGQLTILKRDGGGTSVEVALMEYKEAKDENSDS